MKIVIAPQGFKGNIGATQVAQAIEAGVKRVVTEVTTVIKPMADGGEGTMQAIVDATRGKILEVEVSDPLGEPVIAQWGLLNDKITGVIEIATASGLTLVHPQKRNPLLTTTFGTGQLILAALEKRCRKLIIGLGGSATNDGGAGMAQALGVRFLDCKGAAIPLGGSALSELERIDVTALDPRIDDCEILLASDVNNILCGPNGASCIYGPQKGANPRMVAQLDSALSHYADVIKRDLGVDVRDVPGSGAAGGLATGLMVFLKAKLVPGIDIVAKYVGLEEEFKDADLVLTAEGRIDSQTACGKVPVGVAQKAKVLGLPVIAFAGEIADDYREVYQQGIDAVLSIAPGPISAKQSLAEAERLLADTAERAIRLFICCQKDKLSKRNMAGPDSLG